MSVDLNGNVQMIAQLEDMPCGLDWTPQGRLLVVSAFARRLLRLVWLQGMLQRSQAAQPDGSLR